MPGGQQQPVALGGRRDLGLEVSSHDVEVEEPVAGLLGGEGDGSLGRRAVGLAGEGDHPEGACRHVELGEDQHVVGQHRLRRRREAGRRPRARRATRPACRAATPAGRGARRRRRSRSQMRQCSTAEPSKAAIGRSTSSWSLPKACGANELTATPPRKSSPRWKGSHSIERTPLPMRRRSLGKLGSSSRRASSTRPIDAGRGRARGDQSASGVGGEHRAAAEPCRVGGLAAPARHGGGVQHRPVLVEDAHHPHRVERDQARGRRAPPARSRPAAAGSRRRSRRSRRGRRRGMPGRGEDAAPRPGRGALPSTRA